MQKRTLRTTNFHLGIFLVILDILRIHIQQIKKLCSSGVWGPLFPPKLHSQTVTRQNGHAPGNITTTRGDPRSSANNEDTSQELTKTHIDSITMPLEFW